MVGQKEMNKQRKVVITITYNEMGIIIDTKAEEVTQPNLQPTCNQLATDCISRQAAIDALDKYIAGFDAIDANFLDGLKTAKQLINDLPAVIPERKAEWIPCSERLPEEGQKCLVCDKGIINIDTFYGWAEPYLWRTYLGEYEAWMPLPEPYRKDGEAE